MLELKETRASHSARAFAATQNEQARLEEISELLSDNEKKNQLLSVSGLFMTLFLIMLGIITKQSLKISKQNKKSEELLLNMLPESVATRMKNGEHYIADYFEEATVVFIDMVNFTALSAETNPVDLIELLNSVFSEMDKLTEIYGLEKIKTIGDCYMAVAGIPNKQINHTEQTTVSYTHLTLPTILLV